MAPLLMTLTIMISHVRLCVTCRRQNKHLAALITFISCLGIQMILRTTFQNDTNGENKKMIFDLPWLQGYSFSDNCEVCSVSSLCLSSSVEPPPTPSSCCCTGSSGFESQSSCQMKAEEGQNLNMDERSPSGIISYTDVDCFQFEDDLGVPWLGCQQCAMQSWRG